MPGRLAVVFLVLAALAGALAVACGGGGGKEVALSWRPEDGKPLQVSFDDLAAAHDTVIYVDNDSGRTIEDAVIRFTPATTQSAPAGFSVGTVTTVRTDFDGPSHLWRLGDIRPNTRVVLSMSLWFGAAQQMHSAAPVDLIVELEGANLPASVVSNALTVHFQ
jgi:hypothetical protein